MKQLIHTDCLTHLHLRTANPSNDARDYAIQTEERCDREKVNLCMACSDMRRELIGLGEENALLVQEAWRLETSNFNLESTIHRLEQRLYTPDRITTRNRRLKEQSQSSDLMASHPMASPAKRRSSTLSSPPSASPASTAPDARPIQNSIVGKDSLRMTCRSINATRQSTRRLVVQ